MPPILALALCAVFVLCLLRLDARWRRPESIGFWIAFAWLAIRGSRPLTIWIGGGSPTNGASELEGSPIDRVFALVLIITAFINLQKRQLPWSGVIGANALLACLFLYLLLSTAWAPFPFVAFKRWFKEFGALLIALLILTERDPTATFRMIFVRLAYIHFPLSVILIKYFPHLGRSYSVSGGLMVTGVTDQKNTLGQICVVFGLALLSEILDIAQFPKSPERRLQLAVRWLILGIGVWLLVTSNSQTSLVAFIIGCVLLLATRLRLVARNSQPFATLCFVSISAALIMTAIWSLAAAPLLKALGRDATFTGRTKIWQTVLAQETNPALGSGFYSFWLDKGESVWSEYDNARVNTAHNGYIETYLDGGLIGCSILVLLLLTTGLRAARHYRPDDSFGRLMFAFVVISVVMNYSESYFLRLGTLWFSLVFASLYVRTRASTAPVLDPHRYAVGVPA